MRITFGPVMFRKGWTIISRINFLIVIDVNRQDGQMTRLKTYMGGLCFAAVVLRLMMMSDVKHTKNLFEFVRGTCGAQGQQDDQNV